MRSALASLPERVLLGPGPSNVHPRVMRAISAPVIGHLDPAFISVMEELKDLLRKVFCTRNEFTIPFSGTGSAGMEAALANMIEPADSVIVCINGVFGTRMKEIAERCGANVVTVEAPWGSAIDAGDVEKAMKVTPGVKLVAFVHAETSTGVLQPVDDIWRLAHEHGALVLADTVTSLGGAPVLTDDWGLDIVYSGTQKCLSCPPGLAPVTFNERALNVIRGRKTKVQSWYLDATMLMRYWGEERVYHHTAPISMNYALCEALHLVLEEGLEARWKRHVWNHRALVAGIEAMGLSMAVNEAIRAPMLNAVVVPDGIDEKRVRRSMLDGMNVEIGAGLGPLAGKIWRIGLMGYSSRPENVLTCLSALNAALREQGRRCPDGLNAAIDAFQTD
ncbi:MAG TPA: alanine--glyoxylate aminotransferase family protein [Candidatus Latescibacteria bacterium]|nr:alanine--glyoxylate aminotransferase family protein [Candidatus Latescibacterota bacterium]